MQNLWKWTVKFLRDNRGGGGPEISIPQAPPTPSPSPQETELQDLQLQFFREQAPLQQQAQQQQLGLLQGLTQQAEQFSGLRGELLEPLLRGEAPAGIFGTLGTPFEETQTFERGKERVLSSLAEAGLLDSGIRAELETQLSGQVATESESARRAELANLLNVAVGGAGQIVGEPIALGGQPIQTGLAAGGQALGGQQTTAQRVASFNQQIFSAQLEAAARERESRAAMFGQLFRGIGQAGGAAAGAAAASSKRYKKNIKLWARHYNSSLN